eukprot:232740-Chlamydomonas_euryale.AAC.7
MVGRLGTAQPSPHKQPHARRACVVAKHAKLQAGCVPRPAEMRACKTYSGCAPGSAETCTCCANPVSGQLRSAGKVWARKCEVAANV